MKLVAALKWLFMIFLMSVKSVFFFFSQDVGQVKLKISVDSSNCECFIGTLLNLFVWQSAVNENPIAQIWNLRVPGARGSDPPPPPPPVDSLQKLQAQSKSCWCVLNFSRITVSW